MNLQKTISLFSIRMLTVGDNIGRSLVKPGAKELAERLKKKTPLKPKTPEQIIEEITGRKDIED